MELEDEESGSEVPFGADGVAIVRQLRDACAKSNALATRLSTQASDLWTRLSTAASARYAAQLHSHALSTTLNKLYARNLSLSEGGLPPLSVAAPPMPTATLAQQAHHHFIHEVRSNVVHLLSACASARLMLAHAADHEPRQLIHAVVHGVFGDLAQPTDAKQFGEWLSRVLELHLVLLPNPLPARTHGYTYSALRCSNSLGPTL